MPHGQRVTRAHELPQRVWSGTTCMTSLGAIPIQPSQWGPGIHGIWGTQPTNITWHSLKLSDPSYGSLCKIGIWSPLGGPSASSGSWPSQSHLSRFHNFHRMKLQRCQSSKSVHIFYSLKKKCRADLLRPRLASVSGGASLDAPAPNSRGRKRSPSPGKDGNGKHQNTRNLMRLCWGCSPKLASFTILFGGTPLISSISG